MIIQFNKNSNILKDICQAYDIVKNHNTKEYKLIKDFISSDINITIYLEKNKLSKKDVYFNVIGKVSTNGYFLYDPVKANITYYNENKKNNSFKIILGIIFPALLIIIGIIGFMVYREYNKSQNEKLINNIQQMSSMEKELI